MVAIASVSPAASAVATPSNPNSKGNAFVDCTYASTCQI